MAIRTVLLKIVSASGGEQIVTARSLSGRLANNANFPDVISRLLLEGEAAIELRDGRSATVTIADPEPAQTALTFRPFRPPHHEYEATAQLRFELTAHIQCNASSRAEADYLIGQVLRNECAPPPGFTMTLNDEDVDAFMGQFDNASDRPHHLGVHSHLVTDIRERLLITRQDTSL